MIKGALDCKVLWGDFVGFGFINKIDIGVPYKNQAQR